jgi:hypothetical protein
MAVFPWQLPLAGWGFRTQPSGFHQPNLRFLTSGFRRLRARRRTMAGEQPEASVGGWALRFSLWRLIALVPVSMLTRPITTVSEG